MLTKLRALRPAARAALLVCAASALAAFPSFAQGNPFGNYVSVGDSLTAGFISGGLVDDVQVNSYPSLIFQRATGQPASLFEQPLVSAPGIPSVLQLRSLSPLIITPATGTGVPLNLTLGRPYNNLAVPGAEVSDALRTVSDGGGLHDLILRGIGTQVQQAVALQPTFITVWLGNNDALAAATSGVVIEGLTLTPAASFEADFRAVVGALASTGAGMAIATVPEVTAIPFVTTVPPVVVDPATNQPVLGPNGQVIPLLGPDGPLRPGLDFVLLTATQELAAGKGLPPFLGGTGPLSNQVVLSAAEAATINDRVRVFNNVIRTVSGEVGAAVVDVNAIFGDIARNGLVLGGIDFDAEFLTGGLFSYDGVHATPLGYAIIANAFIDAINAEFGTSIARVGLGPYVFGPLSSRGTGLDRGMAANMIFRRKAENNLRDAFGVPNRGELRRIMHARGIRDLPVNGGGGGNGGGGNGGGGNGGDGPPPACELPAGHPKYCDVCGPCKAGEGDCDLRPNQCGAGLVCAQDVGASYGFHRKIDVCQAP